MGARFSNSHISQPAPGPRNFYLVCGTPSIYYCKEPTHGPLIFDVEIDYDEEESPVERAETFQMVCAVPSKQEYPLTAYDAPGGSHGLLLSFGIGVFEPPKCLAVYAGVDVEYCPGEGVRLVQAKSSQTPFCVLDAAPPHDWEAIQRTTEAIFPRALAPATFTEDSASTSPGLPAGKKRILSAPLVIVLRFEVTNERQELEDGGTERLDDDDDAAEQRPSASTRTRASNGGRRKTTEVVQLTFLDLPSEAFDWTGQPRRCHTNTISNDGNVSLQRRRHADGGGSRATISATASVTGTSAAAGVAALPSKPLFNARTVKQLLQIGTEVYELEDVFDLGAREDATANDDDDNDICVVCLTNTKNTTLLPCRHMCLCYECAGQLRMNGNNKCPICRCGIERLMTL